MFVFEWDEKEEREALLGSGRDEEEGPDGIEREAEQDARLIAIAADEECGRNGHRGIAAVEGKLNHRGLAGRKFHDGLERRHHGIRDVIGKTP